MARRSGPLPDPQPGQWPRLRIIDLNNNRFSGTLGQGWAQTGLFRLVRCLGWVYAEAASMGNV